MITETKGASWDESGYGPGGGGPGHFYRRELTQQGIRDPKSEEGIPGRNLPSETSPSNGAEPLFGHTRSASSLGKYFYLTRRNYLKGVIGKDFNKHLEIASKTSESPLISLMELVFQQRIS